MSKIIKSGWYTSLSDGQSHYCEVKEGSSMYRAKCGALFTLERLDMTTTGNTCYWCEKIKLADERRRQENEQRKAERKEASRVDEDKRGKRTASMDVKRGRELKRERVPDGTKDVGAQPEPGAPPVPGVSSDTGDTGTGEG